ncbi:MAG: tetratricopeptide repeat protein [Acidobacteriota bacterium]
MAAALAVPVWAAAQEMEAHKLFEAGRYDEVAERAESGDPEAAYLAAQGYIRLEQAAKAREMFARLADAEDDVWRLIAKSGTELLRGDAKAAVATARKAVAANDSLALAHYQLGLAASRAEDFKTASAAFGRAAELHPDFAYAYYYGGLAHQRLREIPQAAEDLRTFLTLAPDAPERGAVQAILRTLR